MARMKKRFIPVLAAVSTLLLLAGCAEIYNNRYKHPDPKPPDQQPADPKPADQNAVGQKPTIGQQLIDLKKARDAGAITEAEYEAQKARILDGK